MSQSTSPKSGKNVGILIGIVVVVVAVLLVGAYFVFSGNTPLFGGGVPAANPTPVVAAANTSAPVVLTPVAVTTDAAPIDLPTEEVSDAPEAWRQIYFVSPINIAAKQAVEYSTKGIPPELMKDSLLENLIQRIDSAKKTIHIASLETNLNDVANALIRAKGRGVDVRWITDDEAGIAADTKPGRGQFKMLKDAGISVLDDKRGASMHNKFWLFDGQTTWTGSMDITVSGMFEQNNNVMIIESPELTAVYEGQFEDMWSGKFDAKSPSTIEQQTVKVQGTTIQVLFSPEDKLASHIFPYLQKAKKSIRFMVFAYTQPDIGKIMLEKFKTGVEVKGIFETSGSESGISQLTDLYCAKIPVRQDGNPNTMRHKVIIIDQRIVITGSLDFTDNANKSNNENILIIDSPKIAHLYTTELQRIWEAGHDPDPAKLKCK